jgi:PilZ domain
METKKEKRSEDRVNVALPVWLGLSAGLTHDVSASGICFEADASYTPASEINFEIELKTPSEHMRLQCKGHIVRTENHGLKKSVAVKITESVMQTAN